MKRRIQQEIRTDKTGEYCLESCPQLTKRIGRCKAFFRVIKFRPVGDKLKPVRHQLCKDHEAEK